MTSNTKLTKLIISKKKRIAFTTTSFEIWTAKRRNPCGVTEAKAGTSSKQHLICSRLHESQCMFCTALSIVSVSTNLLSPTRCYYLMSPLLIVAVRHLWFEKATKDTLVASHMPARSVPLLFANLMYEYIAW